MDKKEEERITYMRRVKKLAKEYPVKLSKRQLATIMEKRYGYKASYYYTRFRIEDIY